MVVARLISPRQRQLKEIAAQLQDGSGITDVTSFDITTQDWAGTRSYTLEGGLQEEDYAYLKELLDPLERDFVARGVFRNLLQRRPKPLDEVLWILDRLDAVIEERSTTLADMVEGAQGFAPIVEALEQLSPPRSAPVPVPRTEISRLAEPAGTVLSINCALARQFGVCPSRGGSLPELPLIIPADQAKKLKLTTATPKKRGRRPKYDAVRDRRIYEDWQCAHRRRRLSKKEFAREIGLSYSELGKLLDRVAKAVGARKCRTD